MFVGGGGGGGCHQFHKYYYSLEIESPPHPAPPFHIRAVLFTSSCYYQIILHVCVGGGGGGGGVPNYIDISAVRN